MKSGYSERLVISSRLSFHHEGRWGTVDDFATSFTLNINNNCSLKRGGEGLLLIIVIHILKERFKCMVNHCYTSLSLLAHIHVVGMFQFMFLTQTNWACPLLFSLFLCLFLSLWPFQLYFIQYVLPTSRCSLTLFFWSYFCCVGPFNYTPLYGRYNPLWLTGLKAPTKNNLIPLQNFLPVCLGTDSPIILYAWWVKIHPLLLHSKTVTVLTLWLFHHHTWVIFNMWGNIDKIMKFYCCSA